eukprot:TRINITY_DN762_c0_g1_i11.p1 TRINITY_DN762_c0_g1~~TRINITY_DN762_c0_g1_i11.p1  ORF type:complete len:116 (+),score=26.14 TRINITY_DN762_c0_g1_i11:40-387(+)
MGEKGSKEGMCKYELEGQHAFIKTTKMKINEDIAFNFKKTEGVKRDWALKEDTLLWTEGAGDGTKPPSSTTPSSSALLQLLERREYNDAKEGGEEEIGRAVQQECRDRSRMPSSA